MPRIFDNIDEKILPALQQTLMLSKRADFCVGYFNLRGWHHLAPCIEGWSGASDNTCRLIVGMHRTPKEELRSLYRVDREEAVTRSVVNQRKKVLAADFHQQLIVGMPTARDEVGLRQLAKQLRAQKLTVKLFLRNSLHAKLYLLHRSDPINPIVGYLGSSNLTFSGLSGQGELNIDVLDGDAARKLSLWFENRWNDQYCIDISLELAEIIETSWAREKDLEPYHVYLKMAYHLSQEARSGLAEFRVPKNVDAELFAFQNAAVKIAAHHVNKRGGVIIGDVVGLGKTMIASALVRTLEDLYFDTLILCPKNLVAMWESYRERFGFRAKILPTSLVGRELPNLKRYPLVLIDESHNLRNREGKTYQLIRDYIERNASKVILLTATPYNKTYLDLSAQLRLFVPEDADLGVRPEAYLKTLADGERTFNQLHNAPIRSIQAFEKSDKPDDWRELMRLYMVRRTRSFIQANYTKKDERGKRYLEFSDGKRSYFPTRLPKTLTFALDEMNSTDQYARLYAEDVVEAIEGLYLPRYGLDGDVADQPRDEAEAKLIQDLSRAGARLKGFVKTNLFKRLESGGVAFLQSLERHILRNHVYLYALEHDLDIPIGTLDAAFFDTDITDEEETLITDEAVLIWEERARNVYRTLVAEKQSRFKWARASLFDKKLTRDLKRDANALDKVLKKSGAWDAGADTKLERLYQLLMQDHKDQKVLIFSQFADTVGYLVRELKARGVTHLAGVTGSSDDPTELARRFSPRNHRHRIKPDEELRVLVATDVLSEGQNLQDAFIVVNYDLPWAIIRLIQRVGRVDRIGQQSEDIYAYTFLPAEGLEKVIRLRSRLVQRLRQNAEVVGTDEVFFSSDEAQIIRDLYHEKAGIFNEQDEGEVDLASYAYEIWKRASDADPKLKKIIPELPNVVYSSKANPMRGVLVYLRTPSGNDNLSWVNPEGQIVTESQLEILKTAECAADTPALPRLANHHELVESVAKQVIEQERTSGGNLGRPSSVRYKLFFLLRDYLNRVKSPMFPMAELERVLESLLKYPLKEKARDTLGQLLRQNASEAQLAELAMTMLEEERLCAVQEDNESREPQLICSMGSV